MPLVLGCTLSVVFPAASGYYLLRCARCALERGRHRTGERLSDLAHAAMSAVMIAMLWTGVGGDPWGVQLTVFAVAAGWFFTRALDPGCRLGRDSHRRDARLGLLHEAVMMAAMFWMILAMSVPADAAASATRSGMSMPGAATGSHGGSASSALPATTATLALAGYLAVAALWWVSRYRVAAAGSALGCRTAGPAETAGSGDGRARTRVFFGAVGNAACHALMATAMSLTLMVTL